MLTRGSLDSDGLITLLGNLIDNALDAASSGGGEHWVSIAVTVQGSELVMKVHDSGGGVPAEIADQVFQEGFSTKSRRGKRRGFGLALVRQVARRMGGEVSVVNEGGALFTVRLPLKVPVAP